MEKDIYTWPFLAWLLPVPEMHLYIYIQYSVYKSCCIKQTPTLFRASKKGKMVLHHVEVLSREMVKPSSPTPLHLRNLKLSFLDQIAPPVYIPLIFFYQYEPGCNSDHAQKSKCLKQSLSETLVLFYPLAGRIKSDYIIDCNDDGVEFVEARVHTQLSHIVQNPNMEELKQFLPIEPYGTRTSMVLAIQVNFLDCGGMVIGVCMSHCIADGSSLVTFMNSWATISRGDKIGRAHV